MKCPHIISKRYGDDGIDYCSLTERISGRIKPCLLLIGECEEWNDIKKEWEDESRRNSDEGN